MPRTREETIARILVHGSADGLCAMDRETRYTLWNPTMERFSGKRADEVLGKKMLDVFPFLRDVGLDKAMERTLAGETVVIERVFDLNGLGNLMLNAIGVRDFPVVQGVTIVYAIAVVVLNLVTDLVSARLDPRVRLR